MVTLTYRPGAEWSARDVSGYLMHLRKWCQRRGVPLWAVWRLELQRRGAPHYHVVVWLPSELSCPKPDKQGWWRLGMSQAIWLRKPTHYIAKYTVKDEERAAELPKGARLWGLVGAPDSVGAAVAYARAPGWLRAMATPGAWLRKVKGWWCDPETGIKYRSPWRFDRVSGGVASLVYVGWGPEDVCWPAMGWDLPPKEKRFSLPPVRRGGSWRGLV